MAFITELHQRLAALSERCALNVETSELTRVVDALGDDDLLGLLADAAALTNDLEKLRVVASGIAARRSHRELGHRGLSAVRGHRSPAALIQSIGGGTKAEADRHVRLGTALLDDVPVADDAAPELPEDAPAHADHRCSDARTWKRQLRDAHLDGALTAPQHDAILRGLGDVPALTDPARVGVASEAWMLAAEQLTHEAVALPVEELFRRARQVRDALDPVGAEERFAQRFERRSFRMWTDADGVHRGSIAFDDEMGAWTRSMIDTALRPRRGGPRFVDPDDAAAADQLAADPRTNDQLVYDLVVDVWRAGALTSARDVFGARQPGVRMVVVKDAIGPRDALGRLVATAHLEDGGDPLPGSVAERSLCSNGAVEVTLDERGNPLDVGREQRLYTARQRIALAVRDGGCLAAGCCVPAAFCEAHHCDHWWEHGGRTDIDSGILLCRFHHMRVHNGGWRITRDERGAFVLHPPPGSAELPTILASKSAVRWAWNPPPDRPGWRDGTRPVRPVLEPSGRGQPGG